MANGGARAEDTLLQAIQAIATRVAGPGRTPAQVAPDTRLTEGYWLDSVELLEVVIACETMFNITLDVEADQFNAGAFDTLGSLTDIVRAKIAGRDT